MWVGGREASEGVETCILTVDSCCCAVETSTNIIKLLSSN